MSSTGGFYVAEAEFGPDDAPPARRFGADRPRDEHGRPLDWGAENKIDLEDYEALTVEEDLELGIRHFAARRFFEAHEAWEGAWRLSKGADDESFSQGLAQLGAAFTHMGRGNAKGARVLSFRFIRRVAPFAPCHRGIDVGFAVGAVQAAMVQFLEAERKGLPVPQLDPPEIRRC